MDLSYPFSISFGLADTRAHCVESSQGVYRRLMHYNPKNTSGILEFDALASLAKLGDDPTAVVVDSDKMKDIFISYNMQPTDDYLNADYVVLNTCHIREKATEKVYSDIGKIKKLNRSKKKPIFVLAGCIAQAQGEEIFKRTNYVDIVVGPQSYHRLPEQIKNFAERKENFSDTNFELIEKFDTLDNLKSSRKSKWHAGRAT